MNYGYKKVNNKDRRGCIWYEIGMSQRENSCYDWQKVQEAGKKKKKKTT